LDEIEARRGGKFESHAATSELPYKLDMQAEFGEESRVQAAIDELIVRTEGFENDMEVSRVLDHSVHPFQNFSCATPQGPTVPVCLQSHPRALWAPPSFDECIPLANRDDRRFAAAWNTQSANIFAGPFRSHRLHHKHSQIT
jgi:hypothetical protein